MNAQTLRDYSQLAVKVALNLQRGQRLLVVGPLANSGVSLDAAPVVRGVAAAAYEAGASLVEAIWGDEGLQTIRFKHASSDSFGEVSAWLPSALVEHVDGGHAVLSIYANDPDLLKDEIPDRVGTLQRETSRAFGRFREHISRNETNWAVIAAPSPSWAARVFPGLATDQQVMRLWETIVHVCRLDLPDPLDAWERHLRGLAERAAHLNERRYTALKYRGPGTDLHVGLPDEHLWVSGRTPTVAGIVFTANVPTEEVFTIAHKDLVHGVVRSTKPLSYGSRLIEGFGLRFEAGRVVSFSADTGEAVLRQLVETDDGAGRLGEVALVPHSSPISQSGLLFYNSLFDENAASHLAVGSAYQFTLSGGGDMDAAAFAAAGGNRSAVHVDFMIGSADLDVDGLRRDGAIEPVMRQGEWAFGGS
jgi:aminopeptidase